MKVSRTDIALAILKLSATHTPKRLSRAVASFIVQERRTKELEQIMREVTRLRELHEGVVEINLTSAFPLNEVAKQKIKKILNVDKAVFNEKINKDSIGGVRVETNDTLLDLTVRGRLNRLKTNVQ